MSRVRCDCWHAVVHPSGSRDIRWVDRAQGKIFLVVGDDTEVAVRGPVSAPLPALFLTPALVVVQALLHPCSHFTQSTRPRSGHNFPRVRGVPLRSSRTLTVLQAGGVEREGLRRRYRRGGNILCLRSMAQSSHSMCKVPPTNSARSPSSPTSPVPTLCLCSPLLPNPAPPIPPCAHPHSLPTVQRRPDINKEREVRPEVLLCAWGGRGSSLVWREEGGEAAGVEIYDVADAD